MLVRLCSKPFKHGFSSIWIENFQMDTIDSRSSEFSGGPVWVRTLHIHSCGPGLIPGKGTKIPHAMWHGPREKTINCVSNSVLALVSSCTFFSYMGSNAEHIWQPLKSWRCHCRTLVSIKEKQNKRLLSVWSSSESVMCVHTHPSWVSPPHEEQCTILVYVFSQPDRTAIYPGHLGGQVPTASPKSLL